MVWLVASASTAWAWKPTAVPIAASSRTDSAALFRSVTAPIADSLTSCTTMVKLWLATLPSVDLACTVTVWLSAVSASSALATVTTPELASMANRPPALSVSV